MKVPIEQIQFDERGLVPVVVQDFNTRQVLTLAYMSTESLKRTLETKEAWFFSRSRAKLWRKGETSGHTQRVMEMLVDCDSDALTILVEPAGPACHTGEQSCFHNELQEVSRSGEIADSVSDLGAVLTELYALIKTRERDRPEGSYTTYLFNQGLDKILKKVGEEASETIIAAKNKDASLLAGEVSDLLYHLLVLMVAGGVQLKQVRDELIGRRQKGNAK